MASKVKKDYPLPRDGRCHRVTDPGPLFIRGKCDNNLSNFEHVSMTFRGIFYVLNKIVKNACNMQIYSSNMKKN